MSFKRGQEGSVEADSGSTLNGQLVRLSVECLSKTDKATASAAAKPMGQTRTLRSLERIEPPDWFKLPKQRNPYFSVGNILAKLFSCCSVSESD